MARINRSSNSRRMRNVGKAVELTVRTVGKTAEGVGRWAATDHTGISKSLANMPSMGFLDSVRYILLHLLFTIVSAVVMGAWVFLLVAYGIPFLIMGHF